jgi:electron transfer flavoprotein alpha subunit
METILLLAHPEAGGALAKSAREALHAARALNKAIPGSSLVVGLAGESVQAAADSIAACPATKYYGVAGADFGPSRYSTDAAAAEALCKAAGATIVVAPATSRWNRVLPGVSQRLGGRVDCHVTGIADAAGKPAINRWYYRQRMEASLTRAQRPWFLLIDPGSQTACDCGAGAAAVEMVAAQPAQGGPRTTVLGIREPKADAQTIRPDSPLLFVTGAGWTKKQADGLTHVPEAEKLILGFLKLTRASLGSSKSLGGAALPVASEPDRSDRRDPATRQGLEHLLPRRRAAHRRVAFHWRTPRHQSRPQLRLGARQSRRALCGRRLCGDCESQRAAGGQSMKKQTGRPRAPCLSCCSFMPGAVAPDRRQGWC